MPGTFYLGCPVWSHKGWAGRLFPKGTKQGEYLRLYSRRYSTVEGNTTFYAVPSAETVARWAAETPEAFRFCPKLPREISHASRLAPQAEAAAAFVERVRGLGSRLGPIFMQLPPGYGPRQLGDLAAFLEAWPADARLGVEVRHPAFFEPDGAEALNRLLEARGVGRALMDVRSLKRGAQPGADADLDLARDRKPDVPLQPVLTAPFSLVRYIGQPELPLNDDLLDEWAERAEAWLTRGVDLFFCCHCPDDTFAPDICELLRARLAARGIADAYGTVSGGDETALEQQSLF
jgi:uncharacterized protein YecE (DUF72 family)